MGDKQIKGRLPAQVTVYGAITFGLVIALVITLVKSAYDAALIARINAACNLSNEAVFAGYSNELLDEYNVFALKSGDSINDRLRVYIRDNTGSNLDSVMESAEYNQYSMMTDNGGANIRKEILNYMQYGIYSDIAESMKDSRKQLEKAEKVSEIAESIAVCQDEQLQYDSIILNILELVEGIRTDDNGIVVRGGKPVRLDGYCVKTFVREGINMESTAISDGNVFKVLNNSGMYINLPELLENMIDIGDENYARAKINDLRGIADSMRVKCSRAIELCQEYLNSRVDTSGNVSGCVALIESSKEMIGDELYDGFITDVQNMNESNGDYSLCNVEKMNTLLRIKLADIESLIDGFNIALKASDWEEMCEVVDELYLISCEISNAGIRFDYSKINFQNDTEGLSGIASIKNQLTSGLLQLTIGNNEVSDKTISFNDLASNIGENLSDNDGNVAGNVTEECMYDEYILNKFQSFTSEAKDRFLDYEVEYILAGNESDRKNLEEVVTKLSIFREGVNLTSLISDSEKKNEAFVLAASMLGFTGNAAVIKAGQYMIMTLWAYGESIMDIRELLNGGKASLIKGRDEWHLTLENALKGNLSDDESKTQGVSALDYKNHLRILLLTENSAKKYYRTMGAMELYMIGCGKTDFRMRDYIFSSNGSGVFKVNSRKNLYTVEFGYSYG